MLARVPWRPVQTDKPKARKLSGDRRRQLVSQVVEILDQGEPTRFALEGACRHWLRANLCLKGWSWGQADEAAADIVATALRRLGATRPTWAQGQPEHCQPGIMSQPRDTCAHCGRNLPEGHYRFCSKICAQARHDRRREADIRQMENALSNQAQRASARAKIPERVCLTCMEKFQPRTYGNPNDRWCSDECRKVKRHAA